jgi:hypothetical protein
MVMAGDDRPWADGGYEQQARALFPLDLSPEEYAARHAHEWSVEELRRRFLSDDERAAIAQRRRQEF